MRLRSWELVFLVCPLCGGVSACRSPAPPIEAELVFSDSPPTWVPPLPEVRVSPDQKWAVFGRGRWLRVVDLEAGLDDESRRRGSLDSVSDVVFAAEGKMARQGVKGLRRGWFLDGELVEIPPDATVRFSPDGALVAFHRASEPRRVRVGSLDSPRPYALEGDVRALEWSHDGKELLVLITDDEGVSSLVGLDPEGGSMEPLATDLDAPLRGNAIGVSPDGRTVYLALASAGALDLLARHQVDADRDLDIYELDLTSGDKKLRLGTSMDELSPKVVDDELYWTRIDYRQSIVALPFAGGAAHVVAEGGQIPYWAPDGRRIGYTVGLPRAADAPLNMDADVIEVDARARPIGEPRRVIEGFHEDFSPAWSPDGAWLAFHSHRSPGPVPAYKSEGATDDLYLLRSGASTDEEIRLTDFGWEVGMADWSPDGRRLVFTSWDEHAPGIGIPWVVTIDPRSGQAVELERIGLAEPLRSARLVFWSPVSDEIAIQNDDGSGRQSIWILDLGSRELHKVVEYESDTYSGLDWTPDGETIVYAARFDGRYQIFSVPRAGGTPQKKSEDSGQLLQPQVSPDGRWIAVTRIELTRELWRQKR